MVVICGDVMLCDLVDWIEVHPIVLISNQKIRGNDRQEVIASR